MDDIAPSSSYFRSGGGVIVGGVGGTSSPSAPSRQNMEQHNIINDASSLGDGSGGGGGGGGNTTTVINAPSTSPQSATTMRRRATSLAKRIDREKAATEGILQPGDATSYRQPRVYNEAERERMGTYESVDAFEPHNSAYLDHLQFRYSEPRWFIWVFTLVVGFLSGVCAVMFVAVLHVIMNMKYYLLDYAVKGFPSQSSEEQKSIAKDVFMGVQLPMQGSEHRNVGLGYVVWASFSVLCSLLAAVLLKLVPAARGVGSADVLAYLNGVDNPHMTQKRVFLARIAISLLTIASGACTGYFGTLVQSGVMISTFITERSRLIQFPNINIIRCFRNPKDRRNLAIIGAAAGVGSAFSVTVGGLMYVVEQVAQVIPVRVALYTFCSCLVSSFTMQVYFSYMNNFAERDRSGTNEGTLLTDALIIFNTKLIRTNIVSMNIFDILPTIIIGAFCGGLSVLYVRLSWVSLRLRRRLQNTLWPNFKFLEPVLVTFAYVTITYWIAVAWGPTVASEDKPAVGCSLVPAAFADKRRVSVVGFYGMISSICEQGPVSNATDAGRDPFQPYAVDGRLPVIHNFASLAMSPPDSALQFLLSWSTADYLQLPTLVVFFVIYFLFTSFTAGIAMAGDVILPALVIGGTAGRICGQITRRAVQAAAPDALLWADPALFALIGAGSFLGGVSGMTFSVCIILMEMTGDNRHIICIMIGISISKLVADRFCHPITISHLEAKCVPILDFATRIHKYDMFCARNIMQSPVLTFTSTMAAADIVAALGTTHNGFPVVSGRDRTFKGTVLRWQLEIILWNLYWTRKADPVSYARMREIEDRRFGERITGLPHLSKKLSRVLVDLSPYVDQSAYAIHEATSLSRTYHMFRTLGLRHLVVINRGNQVVGMITRKDLVSDRMMERIQAENDRRRMNLGYAPTGGASVYNDGRDATDEPGSLREGVSPDVSRRPGSVAGSVDSHQEFTQDALSTFLLDKRHQNNNNAVTPDPLYTHNADGSASRAFPSRRLPKLSELVIDEDEDQEYTVIDAADLNDYVIVDGPLAPNTSGSARHSAVPSAREDAAVDDHDDDDDDANNNGGRKSEMPFNTGRASIGNFVRKSAGAEGYLQKKLLTTVDAEALDNFYEVASIRRLAAEARPSESVVTSPIGISGSFVGSPDGLAMVGGGAASSQPFLTAPPHRQQQQRDNNTLHSPIAGDGGYIAPRVAPFPTAVGAGSSEVTNSALRAAANAATSPSFMRGSSSARSGGVVSEVADGGGLTSSPMFAYQQQGNATATTTKTDRQVSYGDDAVVEEEEDTTSGNAAAAAATGADSTADTRDDEAPLAVAVDETSPQRSSKRSSPKPE